MEAIDPKQREECNRVKGLLKAKLLEHTQDMVEQARTCPEVRLGSGRARISASYPVAATEANVQKQKCRQTDLRDVLL